MWRHLHKSYNSKNELVHLPLDVAAQRVGVSKKTLDDYFNQLKLAEKFGFDFDKNQNMKIGKLRAFVRKEKENLLRKKLFKTQIEIANRIKEGL